MQDISLHILDLAQNSIAAGATLIEITIVECQDWSTLSAEVRDNGAGMSEYQLFRASDPFYTTRSTRKVGLGIPMFKASAEASGGHMEISSAEGKGTVIKAVFNTADIDCLPLGRMEETMAALIFCNPDVDFIYTHQYGRNQFRLDTREVRAQLDGVSVAHPDVIGWIKDYIALGLNEVSGGVR